MSLTSENLSSSQLPTLSTTNTTPSTSIKTEPETRLIAHKTRTYHLYRHCSIVYTWYLTCLSLLSTLSSGNCLPCSVFFQTSQFSQKHQKKPCAPLVQISGACCLYQSLIQGHCSPSPHFACGRLPSQLLGTMVASRNISFARLQTLNHVRFSSSENPSNTSLGRLFS